MPPSCIVRTYARKYIYGSHKKQYRVKSSLDSYFAGRSKSPTGTGKRAKSAKRASSKRGKKTTIKRCDIFDALSVDCCRGLFRFISIGSFPVKSYHLRLRIFYSRLPSVDFAMHYVDLMQSQQIRPNVYNQCNLTKDSVYNRNYNKQYHL